MAPANRRALARLACHAGSGGETSLDALEPIRTDRGWVILQMVERKSGDIKPYEEIKEHLRKQLYDQQVEKAQQSWLRELRKKAHVDIR